MATEKIAMTLQKVSDFILSLHSTEESPEDTEHDAHGLFFSQAEEGSLLLNGNEAIQYRQNLKSLINAFGNESISPKAIETLYQKAIFASLDIHEKRQDKSFTQRLETAIGELRNSLNSAPTTFQVYYPVHGLATEGLPIQIGNVQFCIFDEIQLQRFLNTSNGPGTDENSRNRILSYADTIKQSEIFGKPAGLIEVKAIDIHAAKLLAVKELALTIDAINFFSDLIPYQRGYLFLPGDKERQTINVPIISQGEKSSFTFGWEVAGPLVPLSFQQLFDHNEQRNLGFLKIGDLLAKKRTKLEERIISAIEWAGRATIESKKEEAFLLYAISLESLVLSENEKDELTHRLSTRVAHLIGKDLEGRKEISKKVKGLYNIRSKIVHSGTFEVTDADISLIRFYAKGCILRIVNDDPFASMDKIESLVQWFDEKILSG